VILFPHKYFHLLSQIGVPRLSHTHYANGLMAAYFGADPGDVFSPFWFKIHLFPKTGTECFLGV
jgi:hypothetical protein